MTAIPGIKVLTRGEHSIQDRAIHPDAWKVLRRLHSHSHTAYLVGGTVRDLFLGRQPKDFDVATTARPNDIKRLFRNAFMIGRRFRLAHIKFPDSIIEVATFRQASDRFEEPTEEGGEAKAVRLYGTPEEDARRRDFTINGLFYDPFLGNVIDYVGGLIDMDRRVVRTISPPDASYEEDPARMVRAVRAAARLGFAVEAETHQAIVRHRALILRCPRARLLEELLILLKYNSAERSLRLLWQFGLMEFLLPMHNTYLTRQQCIPLEPPKPDLLFDLFAMLDIETSHVEPPVLFSLLIFPFVLEKLSIPAKTFWQPRSVGQLVGAVESVFEEFTKSVDVSKRFRARALEVLVAQPRLILKQSNQRPEKFAAKPYFWDSFRFFQIAARAADLDVRTDAAVWERFKPKPGSHPPAAQSHGRPPNAGHPQGQPGEQGRSRRRRRHRGRKSGPQVASSAPGSAPAAPAISPSTMPS